MKCQECLRLHTIKQCAGVEGKCGYARTEKKDRPCGFYIPK